MSVSWTDVSFDEIHLRGDSGSPSVPGMFSTLLTRRRAVDHCRVRSSLCRMS
jgi:hypothetical protein